MLKQIYIYEIGLFFIIIALIFCSEQSKPSHETKTEKSVPSKQSSDKQAKSSKAVRDELSKPSEKANTEQPQEIIKKRSREILRALKEKNMKKLAEYVHPEKGVRISPSGYIDVKSDVVLTPAKIRRAETNIYHWGYEDGSGDSIKLSFGNFIDTYLYDYDFLKAQETGYEEVIQKGNTKVNITEVYPNSKFITYHFPGTDKNDHFDWRSLRLVFEKKNETWYLVGISHDQWTI
ncbi:hypothetical protein GF337_08505 [candidate division KSB1 bacterium]|nr:hypothetical protein [candidate division KSB1 bacterium]